MVCDGLVFHPLQGDLSLGVDAAARVSASSDVLWPPPTGAAEIALAPSADTLKRQQEQHFERRYRARVFGDWHRRCVHPRLPYLAAYGVVGEAAAVAPDIAEPLPLNEVASAADLWSGDALRVVDIGDQARRATADAAQQNATAAAAALHFPECLSSDHKSPSIQLDGDHEARPRRALYGGPGRSDMDAASVRANCPVPPEVCLYYYEMKVIDSGAQGFIGLGLCAGDVQLDRLPGWERNSIGWHGDDGHIFRDSGMGTAYGPKYGTGDIVGCCWNRITGDVYFTKQGALLKRAFRNVGPSRLLPPKPTAPANGGDGVDSARQRRAESWYPVVGLRTCGEVVEVNFGQQPFLFDLETYVRREVEQYLGQLAAAPTAPSGVHSAQQLQEEQRAARRAIVDYLLTEGYDRTARAFLQAMASEEMEEEQQGGNALQAREYQHALTEAAQRAHVMECIERGDIDAALRECAAELTSPTSSAGPRRSARSSGRRNEASRPATRWSDVAVAAADDGGGGDVDNISDAFYATLLLRCQKFIEMLRDGPDHPQLLAALVFARQELWPLVQPEPHSAKPLRALADGSMGATVPLDTSTAQPTVVRTVGRVRDSAAGARIRPPPCGIVGYSDDDRRFAAAGTNAPRTLFRGSQSRAATTTPAACSSEPVVPLSGLATGTRAAASEFVDGAAGAVRPQNGRAHHRTGSVVAMPDTVRRRRRVARSVVGSSGPLAIRLANAHRVPSL
eukprot:ctg_2058.g522